METITIQKEELTDLIKETTTQILQEEFNKIGYAFVSNQEQRELERKFGKTPIFDETDEVVKL